MNRSATRFTTRTLQALALSTALIAGTASAAPIRLDYSISSAGGGLYQYDFTYTLDNSDSSWVSGQTWDWFVFGDRPASGEPSAFGFDWTWLSSDADFESFSSGGSEGPTACFGTSCSVSDGGWTPLALGDSFSGSGLSSILVTGDLYWTALAAGNGASRIIRELGNPITNVVPIPATFWLFGSALVGLIGLGRRNKVALRNQAS